MKPKKKMIRCRVTGAQNFENQKLAELIQRGEFRRAWPLFKREMLEIDLAAARIEEVYHQALLSRALGASGLILIPLRIAERLLVAISRSTYESPEKWKLVYTCLVTLNIIHRVDLVLSWSRVFFKMDPIMELKHIGSAFSVAGVYAPFCELIYVQSLTMSGESIDFESWLQDFLQRAQSSPLICFHAKALSLQNKYDSKLLNARECRDLLKEIEPFENECQKEGLQGLIEAQQRLRDRILVQMKDNVGKNLWRDSKAFKTSAAYSEIEKYFYKKIFFNSQLSLSEEISLIGYPANFAYLKISGSQYLSEQPVFLNQRLRSYQKKYFHKTHKGDRYKISGGQLTVDSLRSEKLSSRKGKFIDLIAGLYFQGSKVRHLSSRRVQALSAILGSGKIGLGEIQLVEICYAEERASIESLFLRARDLVTQLQKQGFPIFRANGLIFWDFENQEIEIVFSTSHRSQGVFYQWRQHLSEAESFKRKELSQYFQISVRKTNEILADWIEQKKVARVSLGRYQMNPNFKSDLNSIL